MLKKRWELYKITLELSDTHTGVKSEINLIWKGVFVIVVGSCK